MGEAAQLKVVPHWLCHRDEILSQLLVLKLGYGSRLLGTEKWEKTSDQAHIIIAPAEPLIVVSIYPNDPVVVESQYAHRVTLQLKGKGNEGKIWVTPCIYCTPSSYPSS